MNKENIGRRFCKYRVAQKTSRTFACIILSSSRNESMQKHICNEQTSL